MSREAIEGEVNAEVVRACDAVMASGQSAASTVQYDGGWASVVDEAGLIGAVQGCVLQAEAAEAASAAPVDVDTVVKDPDAVTGQVFALVTEITQYDAATGVCAFRGYWDNQAHEYNFEYAGDNALFTAGDGKSDCPVLGGIDQDDVVRVWARSEGSLTYSTQIGGSTTVPSFRVLKAEVIEKK